MHYQEYIPTAALSHHVECFWELRAKPEELASGSDILPPDCTFEMVFSDQPFDLKSIDGGTTLRIGQRASFIGQRTNSCFFETTRPIDLFGIRFKPFAFVNLIKVPLYALNDSVLPITSLFDIASREEKIIDLLVTGKHEGVKVEYAEKLLLEMFHDSLQVDENIRDQTNYILDRKGMVKVNDLLANYGTTKATLRSHFIKKIGLAPKQMARIWRLNYFLQLSKDKGTQSLTELCLEAGFFDQAHFIKEFKSFFRTSPRKFFKTDSQLLKVSQGIISRRFSHQYDPRF